MSNEFTIVNDPKSSSPSGKYFLFGALALLAYQLLPPASPVAKTASSVQTPLDMFEALDRVRAAAKLQRAKLVAANRMPVETAISRLVAEAYDKYKREDELAAASPGSPGSVVTPSASTYSRPASTQTPASIVPPVSRGSYRPPPVPKAAATQSSKPAPPAPAIPPKPAVPTGPAKPPVRQPGIGAMPTARKFQNADIPANSSGKRRKTGEVEAGLLEVVRLVTQRHPQAIGVFLGVGTGALAVETLKQWKQSPGLYLVDPYIRQLEAKDQRSDKELQLEFEGARDRLKNFEGRHAFVRDLSYSFVTTMRDQNAQAALVLIDKDDREAAIHKDLTDWWPMVGKEGILAGRVYEAENKIAIDRFAKDAKLTVKRAGDVWYFEKL